MSRLFRTACRRVAVLLSPAETTSGECCVKVKANAKRNANAMTREILALLVMPHRTVASADTLQLISLRLGSPTALPLKQNKKAPRCRDSKTALLQVAVFTFARSGGVQFLNCCSAQLHQPLMTLFLQDVFNY